MKSTTHYQELEKNYFISFIYEAFANELGHKITSKVDDFYKLLNIYYKNMLQNEQLCKINIEKIHYQIKYSNSQNKENILSNITNKNEYVCFISLTKCKEEVNLNYTILGDNYIKYLVKKYPTLWWNFMTQIDKHAQIRFDYNNRIATMQGDIIAKSIIQEIDYALPISRINELSEMNKREFIREIKEKMPAMILGNGVSIPFGCDTWSDMITYLFSYLSPLYLDSLENVKKAIGNSNYFSASMSKLTIEKAKYNEAIKSSIYKKYEQRMHNTSTLLHSVAIIKSRLINMPLITYNYDCFLENEFKTFYRTINIKTIYNSKMDKKYPEPKILHVHGFIDSKKSSKPKNMILTDEEYFNSYKGKNWVVSAQQKALEKNICLYVGSSMSDLFQLSLIYKASKKHNQRSIKNHKKVWYCYALMCLPSLTPKDILTINNYFLRKSIKIIFVDNYEKLPNKLLELFEII